MAADKYYYFVHMVPLVNPIHAWGYPYLCPFYARRTNYDMSISLTYHLLCYCALKKHRVLHMWTWYTESVFCTVICSDTRSTRLDLEFASCIGCIGLHTLCIPLAGACHRMRQQYRVRTKKEIQYLAMPDRIHYAHDQSNLEYRIQTDREYSNHSIFPPCSSS